MIFLLKFSRSFRTTPTNSRNVILGIPPLYIAAKSQFLKFQIWNLRSKNYLDICDPDLLDEYRDIKFIDSKSKILDLSSPIEEDFVVYTDGPSSVFQTEFSAINFTVCWALEVRVRIEIFSDSLSSIDGLASTSTKSSFVLNIKGNILRSNGLVNLTWVRAHPGNPGNELADYFVKIPTDCGEILRVPAPYSFLKKVLF
ncbi:hypothetical protein AVEN_45628-1 [Araneus ventricosus]|uniref:RNase H type-1 domain-containing protein n=1 Tax=Araneus ventricosus TaxID=182803 RepID=A0A4Y2EUW2_ARAVE|nr:hypothetical protein AVEN_45628-1 [Araneus ventricosus]